MPNARSLCLSKIRRRPNDRLSGNVEGGGGNALSVVRIIGIREVFC